MFVKDMADLFPAYDDEDARECIEGDFASLGAERGGAVLRPRGRHSRGLHAGAEHLDVCLYVALGEGYAGRAKTPA